MNGFWGQIAGQIAMAFVMPLVAAAAAAIVGWVAWWWHRLFKVEFDTKSRATLQDALQRGMSVGIQAAIAKKGYLFLTDDTRSQLVNEAASYVEKWSGGTVKRFGLTHSDLTELATAHLPMPANLQPPAAQLVAPVPATRKAAR